AQAMSCTPSVALGEPVAAPLTSFECPAGWDERSRNSVLPIAGRFGSARELVDALCTQSDDSELPTEPIGIDIDFEANDVVAVAYEGEISLHRRGGELWIRHTASCEASYETALFVIAKGSEPREQTCSSPCP